VRQTRAAVRRMIASRGLSRTSARGASASRSWRGYGPYGLTVDDSDVFEVWVVPIGGLDTAPGDFIGVRWIAVIERIPQNASVEHIGLVAAHWSVAVRSVVLAVVQLEERLHVLENVAIDRVEVAWTDADRSDAPSALWRTTRKRRR
jgi:hypothetical protein